MNKQRRKQLTEAIGLIRQAAEIIADVKDEEQEALDNLPESLQESQRAEAMQGCIDLLEDAQDDLESKVNELEEYILN